MVNKSEKETALKKFINENKSLAFMLPVLAILVIILIIVYSGVFSKEIPASNNTPAPIESPGEAVGGTQPKVEVLPQIIRSENENTSEIIKDPFETPMKLKGVISSEERSAAIVESGGISYIVSVDDYIGKSSWKVTAILKKSINIESNGEKLTLELMTETKGQN